ncbi:uncharacterized protein LOC100904947 [Galendromus occidentalis]|uniref:Uncharacterized protein LOC100904947 n=1 Tax=Galendromus occidentalis TaxID=34638 RepID=A0AAJ6QT10_9ACAR|nr:uncharacterized protein LOC100904947 [Galendromus occidentalis]
MRPTTWAFSATVVLGVLLPAAVTNAAPSVAAERALNGTTIIAGQAARADAPSTLPATTANPGKSVTSSQSSVKSSVSPLEPRLEIGHSAEKAREELGATSMPEQKFSEVNVEENMVMSDQEANRLKPNHRKVVQQQHRENVEKVIGEAQFDFEHYIVPSLFGAPEDNSKSERVDQAAPRVPLPVLEVPDASALRKILEFLGLDEILVEQPLQESDRPVKGSLQRDGGGDDEMLIVKSVKVNVRKTFTQIQNFQLGLPTPYQFAYRVDTTEGSHGHAEVSDGNGRVEGFYVINLGDGRIRTVKYYADETGFHPTVESNEPGVASSAPADAPFSVFALDERGAATRKPIPAEAPVALPSPVPIPNRVTEPAPVPASIPQPEALPVAVPPPEAQLVSIAAPAAASVAEASVEAPRSELAPVVVSAPVAASAAGIASAEALPAKTALEKPASSDIPKVSDLPAAGSALSERRIFGSGDSGEFSDETSADSTTSWEEC